MESSTPSRDTAWAMSQENVEIVRKWVVDLFVDPDPANMSDVDPDMVWNPVTRRRRSGHDGVRAAVARWEGEWDEYEATAEEFVDMGDRVVATAQFHGRGRGCGVETDARPARPSEEAARAAGAELTGTITGTQLGEEVH